MPSNVGVGLVTFNRKKDLVRGLAKLAESTVKPAAVYVVDSASTDGTFEYLVASGYIFREIPNAYKDEGITHISEARLLDDTRLVYCLMADNRGGAGGFHLAQHLIVDAGHEWLWLMDDDGYPSEACLARLVESAELHNISVLNPLVLEIGEEEKLAFGLLGGIATKSQAVRRAEDDIIKGKANPFNGTFISADIVSAVGYVKKEMFIWGDEAEYMLRIQKAGFEYATDTTAIFYHPYSKTKLERFLWRFWIPTKPAKLEMNFYRNRGYIYRNYRQSLGSFYLAKYTLYFISKFDFGRLYNFYRYYFDGWLDRYKLVCIRKGHE